MASLNKVLFMGNTGKEPEVRYLPDGTAVATVSLAVTEKRKDKAGNKVEETEWINLKFFGRLAEIVEQYVPKGQTIYVEGKLTTEKWEDKNKVKQYKTVIVCSEMQLLGGKPRDAAQSAPKSSTQPASKGDGAGEKPAGAGQPRLSDADFDDSIPY